MARFVSMLTIGFVMLAGIASAQPTIKKTPITQTSPIAGKEMFKTYCAPCHGLDAKGDGPAAPALKKAPANLTELSARNGGKFPDNKVMSTIRGGTETPAHGSRDMPMWGSLFSSLNTDQALVQLRISNLTDYLKSIQAK